MNRSKLTAYCPAASIRKRKCASGWHSCNTTLEADAAIEEAVCAKLDSEKSKAKDKAGWRAVWGAADPQDVEEVQRIIDEEFSRIDPEGW